MSRLELVAAAIESVDAIVVVPSTDRRNVTPVLAGVASALVAVAASLRTRATGVPTDIGRRGRGRAIIAD